MSTSATPAKVVGAVAGFVGAVVDSTKATTMGTQQLLLLLALYVHGPINQTDLPRYTGVEKSANSRNIAVLGPGVWAVNRTTGSKKFDEGLGLVEAYEEPTDRRFKMVRLTPKGRALLDMAAKQVMPFFAR